MPIDGGTDPAWAFQRRQLSQSALCSDRIFSKILEHLADAHEVQCSRVDRLLEENGALRAQLKAHGVDSLHLASEILVVPESVAPHDKGLRFAARHDVEADVMIAPEFANPLQQRVSPADEPPHLPGCLRLDDKEVCNVEQYSFEIHASSSSNAQLMQMASLSEKSKNIEKPSTTSPARVLSIGDPMYKEALKEIEGIDENSDGSCYSSQRSRKSRNSSAKSVEPTTDGFTLWKTWEVQASRLQRRFSKISKCSSKMSERNSRNSWARRTRRQFSLPDLTSALLQRFVIMPNSPYRIAWDLTGMILLFYDMVVIPLMAFQLEESPFWVSMSLVTLVFWTFDMLLSLTTGYVSKGKTITDARRIRKHYFRTWFALDLVVLVPDWIFTFLHFFKGRNGGESNVGKLLRTFRAIRVMRLLRLAKMRYAMVIITDMIDSECMFLILNVVKYLVMLVLVNHFIGAGWYLVGDYSHDRGMKSWIDAEEDFIESSLAYRYLTSLHWSLAQFTPGPMSAKPHNTLERSYAVSCLILGLLLFSSFISSITASMTQLRNMQGETSRQLWLLRRFLRQNSVDKALEFRIQRYLEYAVINSENVIQENKITIMNLLSNQLSDELHYTVSYTVLQIHPLFETSLEISSLTMFRLCRRALSKISLAPSDVLFKNGKETGHMYFVPRGRIRYIRGEEQGFLYVQGEDWLCEHALWTKWLHLGEARAMNESEVVSVQVAAFGKEMLDDVNLHERISEYARNYVKWLNSVPFEDLSDACLGFEACDLASSFLGKEGSFRSARSAGLLSPFFQKPSLRSACGMLA